MAQFCVLVARMRSGTTAFRNALATHPSVFTIGEIFHSNGVNEPLFFYNFLVRKVREDPTLALPSEENRRLLFGEYLDHLSRSLHFRPDDGKIEVLGVNYNSLHSLNGYWHHPFARPLMFGIFAKLNVSIIHLERRNILRTLLSEHRARSSGIWHRRNEGDEIAGPIELPVGRLVQELTERQSEITLMKQWLRNFPKHLEITFEETFGAGNRINAEILTKCAAFFGLKDEFNQVASYYPTSSGSLRELMANYDAVSQVLADGPFAWMLEDAPPQT